MLNPDWERRQEVVDNQELRRNLSRIPQKSEHLMWLLDFVQGKKTNTPYLKEIILQESVYYHRGVPETRIPRLMATPDAIRLPLNAAGISVISYIR